MSTVAVHNIEHLRLSGLRAWLDTSSPFAPVLENRLEEIASIPSGFRTIPTRSRSRRVWEGRLDGIPFPLVIKQRWLNPSYALGRRISCRVSLCLESPFRQALELAARLDAIGFPSPRPILCWKKGSRFFPDEEGILYPEIEARDSLRRYLHEPSTGNPLDRRLLLSPETLSALGRFLRTLNAAGFVHLDPTPQNILLRPGAAEPPTETSFVFIDVESFRPLPSGRPETPRARYARALALTPLLPHIPGPDLSLFAESFALPSESPATWQSIFSLLQRHPKPHALARLSFRLQTLPSFQP